MITNLNFYSLSGTNEEDNELAMWVWNSHWWVEEVSGYYKCKWCGARHTSMAGITKDYPLCTENPCVKNFLLSKLLLDILKGE